MKLLALVLSGLDQGDADVELIDGSRVRVRFDVSPQADSALASWEPDVFHDEPMPPGGVGKIVDAVLCFHAAAHRLDES